VVRKEQAYNMKTVSKLLLIASIGILVFFTTHLIFFDKEVKNLITLNGVDHILHHIVLLKFLVGAIFTALCGVLVFEFLPSKVVIPTRCNNCGSTNLNYDGDICITCGSKTWLPDDKECIDCKISKI
jgi:ribosomal protein L37E